MDDFWKNELNSGWWTKVLDNVRLNIEIGELTGSRFVCNMPRECREYIIQAASDIGYDCIEVKPRGYHQEFEGKLSPVEQFRLLSMISIFTRDINRDLTPFWVRLEEICPQEILFGRKSSR